MKRIFVTAALALALPSVPAFAWGRVGHQMVARIAELRIAPATRAKIQKILQQDPGDPAQKVCGGGGASSSASDGFNLQGEGEAEGFELAGGDPTSVGLVRVALYGDQIRDLPMGDGTAHWHFADIDYEATRSSFDNESFCKRRIRPKFAFNAAKNCYDKLPSSTKSVFHDDDCSFKRVDQFVQTLAGGSGSARDRAFALKMLVHVVGDVHQPLHNAEWNSDVGGNGRRVTFFNSNTLQGTFYDLHKVWDSSLLERMVQLAMAQEKKQSPQEALNHYLNAGDVDQFARFLNRRIDQAVAAGWFEGSSKPKDWAWEAHELAVKFSYNGAKKNFQSAFDGSGSGILKVDDTYLNAARPALLNQVMRAGYRLATLLDQAFAN